jgi:diguanylate cyclase
MKKSKLLWIFAGILILVNIVFYLTKWGGENFLKIFSDSLPIICAFISSLCLFAAFRGFKELDFAKLAWMLIFIGITADFIAETVYAVLEIGFKMDMNVVFPSLADYFWCGAYIPLIIGLAMMFFGYKSSGFPMGNMKLYGLIALGCLVLSGSLIYYLLIPIINDKATSGLAKFFYLYYPIGDLFLVIPALILMYITSLFGKGALSKPWKYLAIGFVCFTLADIIYSFLSWKGLYGSGNFIDLAWHAGYLLVGLAGLYQKELMESFKEGATL